MKLQNFLFLISFILLIASCGIDSSSSSDSSSNSSSDDEKNITNAVEKSKNALKDLLSDGKEDGKSVEVINWRELKDLLPNKLGGMKLADTEGQTTGMMGFKFSNTEGTYKNDDGGRLNVTIIDAGGVGFLVKQFASWSELEIDSDTSEGYQRTTEYKGYKAMEQYDEKNKSGSFTVLVENRFVLTINGREIEMDDLKDAIDDVGVKKLARLAS